ncbi:phenylalanine--tRNA ligase subunit beta [Prosthecochloris vibrioformis]|uniref:Phenylalanine--tRNA ligase beta subunit n=1 Tax=Prosthecochloris vibrioformis TaxID=1098 RepID=A0A5C4RYG2_PROVB|nr:phenylalanine--tRNA ligase subunit beta [Prosthecochloris vibrioformis]TNJ36008.1 phenylalanine--tRNA ligase subunit beta [Prosthecochloris vibrioformis]
MKISVNWLQDFIPSFAPDIPSFVDQLTYSGLEVEGIETTTLPDDKVLVGHVLSVAQHPDADRLKMCMVDVGQDEPLQIVCGAPNVATGMKVPVATIGAKLTTASGESFTIKKSKLRGQRSFGMICAADELGLPGGHDGVMELDPEAVTGALFASCLQADTVLDIAVTPNRPDVLSHFGVAREVAGTEQVVRPSAPTLSFAPSSTLIELADRDACPYYSGVVIRGIKVAESPLWLRDRLESIGLKPKNNIVDITNYILHAFGQPLHAFDLAALEGPGVRVRTDIDRELQVLNQEICRLRPGMAVICDHEKPLAVAGVMGGFDSAVTVSTTDILLESAWFEPASVRKTAKQLGLSTDASYRYERGVDPRGVIPAAEYAVMLILELAGGEVVESAVAGGLPGDPAPVMFRPSRARDILGCDIDDEDMVAMLSFIGFAPLERSDAGILFSVPSFRFDVEQEIDLVEEVARLKGYDTIEASGRMVASYPQARSFPEHFPDFLRALMAGLQFREVLTNPLMTKREAGLFSEKTVAPLNPISEGLEVLRPSLVPAILKVVGHNIRHGNRDLQLFEVANSFEESNGRNDTDNPLQDYLERETLALVVTGSRYPVNWSHKPEQVDFYDLKGAVEMLLDKLNLLDKSALNIYNDNTLSIEVRLDDGKESPVFQAGRIMIMPEEVLKEFDIDQPVFAAELDVDVLARCYKRDVVYQSPSKYPVVQRDLSFQVPERVTAHDLLGCIGSCDELIRNVTVFDLFERKMDDGTTEKSVAVAMYLGDNRATLKDEQINSIISKVVARVESELGAVIRQA